MSDSVRITYHGMNPSPAVDAAIKERSEKLFQLFDRISSCRVVVEAPIRAKTKAIYTTCMWNCTCRGRCS